MIEFEKSPEDFLAAGLEEAKQDLEIYAKSLAKAEEVVAKAEEVVATRRAEHDEARAVVERYEAALAKVSALVEDPEVRPDPFKYSDPEDREVVSLADLRRSRPGLKFRDNEGRLWTRRGTTMESPGGSEKLSLRVFVRDFNPITRVDEGATSDER